MRAFLVLTAGFSLALAGSALAQRVGGTGGAGSPSGSGMGAPLRSPGALSDPAGMIGGATSSNGAGAIGAPGLGSVTGGVDVGPTLRAGSTVARPSGVTRPGVSAPIGAPTVNGGGVSPGATPNASGANPGGPGATPDSLRTTPGGPAAGPGSPYR